MFDKEALYFKSYTRCIGFKNNNSITGFYLKLRKAWFIFIYYITKLVKNLCLQTFMPNFIGTA